jgi:Fe-Mn family superoxide dismutase
MQIEKHNMNVFPAYPILLVLDVFEHAYYIDYKNDRAKYVEAFWNICRWESAAMRLAQAQSAIKA